MARERRRLLIPPGRLASRIALSPPERHYLTRVLRLAVGQGCDVVDGAGHRWGALLAADGFLALEQPLAAPLEAHPPPAPCLELALALPRQDVEVAWRMATELGIDRLQPLLADRCQQRERWPLERWHAILREASEQCERLWLPELAEPLAAQAWLAEAGGAPGPAGFTGDPWLTQAGEGAPRIGPDEGFTVTASRGRELNLLASSRGDQLPLLPHLLQAATGLGKDGTAPERGPTPQEQEPAALRDGRGHHTTGQTKTTAAAALNTTRQGLGPDPGPRRVRLAIGPEGGWSPAEEETARAQGWIAVSAGPTILRTSTAAVAAAAWLTGWRAALSSSSSPWPVP
jgi:16S rRNA U1498 N3-methylase RsmE